MLRFGKVVLLLLLFLSVETVLGQSRKIIRIPDIPGYLTLKCDFHMHTVFSDGTVWPTVRVEEAKREGLDAIAITDHIEYRPHSKDVVADHNRSFEIAKPLADALDIILIRSAEITRSMPPGHINALFIENANLLEREDGLDAIREAREQGAFLLWNHPGWKAQQPDTTIWWEEHTQLLKNDLLHGIEVFNEKEFYPEALTWAKQKKLAVLCNSDVHGPTNMSYDLEQANRPLTLVFSENRSVGSIKDALFKRRTAAFFNNTLAGPSSLLEPLFFSSLKMKKQALGLEDQKSVTIDIINNSDLDYELELVQPTVGFEAPETLTLKAQHATAMELTGNSPDVSGLSELEIYYSVKNMLVWEDKNLVVTFSFQNK